MKWSRLLFLIFLVVAFATSALAQAPSPFLTVYTIGVRPGASAQFRDYIAKIKEGAEKVGASQHWTTMQVGFGGPGNTYLVVLGFNEWGDIDGWTAVPDILEKAFGEEEAATIQRSGGSAIESSETAIYSLLEDLSYNLEANAPAPRYVVRMSTVKRDMQRDYQVFLQRLNEAWEKAGDPRTIIRRASVLGSTSMYVSATPFEKWSERDGLGNVWELLADAHGELEARRLEDSVNASVVSSEVFVITVLPELSRLPESPTSDD